MRLNAHPAASLRFLRLLAILSIALCLCLPARVGQAQGGSRLTVFPPDTSQFPEISLPLVIYDASGAFVSSLAAADLTVVENGSSLPVEILEEERRGVDFAVVVNAGQSLGVHGSDGQSRYEVIADTLQIWASQGARSSLDNYSLYTEDGQPATRLLLSAWLEAFAAYQPDFKTAKPGLNGLSAAIDALSQPEEGLSQPASERVILWITPLPEGPAFDGLGSLGERLQQAGIHLFIWSASPSSAFESAGAAALNDLALATGGQYFPFSGPEALPDPETYLGPLRGFYRAHYTSAIRQGGPQSVAVQVRLPDESSLESDPLSFDLPLASPNPMLVSPPATIQRASPPGSLHPDQDLAPRSQEIHILVEFPGGSRRALLATRLYVDGQVVAENTAEPFDVFTWDLSGYTTSGTHRLKVEAVDDLGLSKQSLETPVEVTVSLPEAGLGDGLTARLTPAAYAGLGMGALALVIGAGWGVRKWRRKTGGAAPARAGKPGRRPSRSAPAAASQEPETAASTRARATPAAIASGKPLAYLAPLDEQNRPLSEQPLPIAGREVTLGHEPRQATLVLSGPAVDGLHARLRLGTDGGYTLSDMGSVAGTWVNYTPVPPEGTPLTHGDLVHVGGMAFRFLYAKPERLPKPVVRPYNGAA